jgi:pimeloyl-ACP methyl ester carboxylesterase
MGTAALIALLAALALWAGAEALRRPLDAGARNAAPGRFAELSRGRTHYRFHSDANGPVVVLIHGLVTPSFVWNALIPTLGRMGFRVLSYDLYGRGWSDRPVAPQDRTLLAGQVRELLDLHALTRPVTLIGYSMGGAVAAAFAAENPSRVGRLIVLAPAGLRYRPMRFLALAARLPVLGDWLWRVFGGIALRRQARASEDGSLIPQIGERIARETRSRGFLRSVLSSQRHLLSDDLTDAWVAIGAAGIPTLALWGERDATIPASNAGPLAAAHRGARQEVIAGAGHGLVHTHPREVLAEIAAFLKPPA